MNKELTISFAWGSGLIALAILAIAARKLGYIDGDMVTRIVTGMNGIMIAYYGNRLPKSVVSSGCKRRVNRVGGWAMVLSGLAYVALFAFAPIPVAVAVGSGAVIAGIGATLGYCLWLRAATNAI